MNNKEWMKKQTKEKQIEIYGKAYDLMTFRKAYHGENLTVDKAITMIKENEISR